MIELLWNFSQDQAITEIQEVVSKAHAKDAKTITRLAEENRELQLRVGVLIRLLIDRGVFKAEDYASLLEETKVRLAKPASNRPKRTSAR